MIIDKNAKRLLIYFFYDNDGIVDDYVPYMLKSMRDSVSRIQIVVNGKLTVEGRNTLTEVSDDIYVRENIGFDVWAYKSAMELYGWNKLSEYDEIILMNSTIMGPLYPISEVFDKMDKMDLDFWGLTLFHKLNADPFGNAKYGYLPTHIQSHFIAVRNNMIKSEAFQQYWDNMQMIHNYAEAVGCHEAIFTKTFEDEGFVWSAYNDTRDVNSEGYYPLMRDAYKMVKEYRCPIFKKRMFFDEYEHTFSETSGETISLAYDYINNNTNYDTNLIWKPVLRSYNQSDIKENMGLNYVLEDRVAYNTNIEQKKIALIIHSYFKDLVSYCCEYAKSMPSYADVYVTTDTEEKLQEVEKVFSSLPNKVKVIKIENRGRDVSALLTGCKDFIMDYDYVCFAHDKKVTQLDKVTKGESFSYRCWENILTTPEYVSNVIDLFDKNERLGMISPPPPNNGEYFFTYSPDAQWYGSNYDETIKLKDKLNLKVNIDRNKNPIAPLGTMFWFRPKAMKKLFDVDWKYEDFPPEPNKVDGTMLHGVERIYPFVVQDAGYYPAFVLSSTYAQREISNMQYMLTQITKPAFQLFGMNSLYGLTSCMTYYKNVSDTNSNAENIVDTDKIYRELTKQKMKNKIPKRVWLFFKKIYKIFGGKKWIAK